MICTLCGEDKDKDEMVADSRRRDGLSSRCKSCHAANMVKHRARLKRKEAPKVIRVKWQGIPWPASPRFD